MAAVAGRFGSPPPLPLPSPRLRRRAAFSAGARRNSTRILSRLDSCAAKASASGAEPSDSASGENASEIIDAMEVKSTSPAASFLAKVALALGVAATATVISLFMNQPSSGPSFSLPQIIDASASPDAVATIGYTFSLSGKKVIIPEYTPGWVYFWLLMAAGFGLFISEEALNVWVGISLARSLCLDGTWQSLVNSFSTNASYIISTVLWVYWAYQQIVISLEFAVVVYLLFLFSWLSVFSCENGLSLHLQVLQQLWECGLSYLMQQLHVPHCSSTLPVAHPLTECGDP
uniref:Uncharacterized protein n=1 Tax=Leersia perrieri TaxID=77586 RepID=A0A0D9VD41_9ORYZ